MILLHLHEATTAYLAVNEITPQDPPFADKLLKVMGWVKWGLVISGVMAIAFAGGKFGWEKWSGGSMESPKQVLGAGIGGVFLVSGAAIMNAVTGS